ncbi:MAG: recombinase family protein [Thermodesulfobacteriota bacterium]
MKVGAYIRVSTEEQAKEGISLDLQEEKLRAYCKVYDLDIEVIERDEGISAKDIKGRPGVQCLFEMARRAEIEGIIVYKIDRLFRNRIDALVTEEELRSAGVTLHSVTEHIDTTTAMGRHIFAIIVSQAAFERELISERTRDALRHKKAAGQVYNHAPYGWDDVDGELQANLYEQSIISTMADMKLDGASLQAIADTLNKNGVPTKGYGKVKRREGRWHPQTVKAVLDREDL